MPGDILLPTIAAAAYEKILREFFNPSTLGDDQGATPTQKSRFPSFDLILLGLGKDGHTASLFPGDGTVQEENRWVAAVNNPRGSPPVPRITLTLPVINRAKTVIFLVSGIEKRDVIRSILDDSEWAGRLYPAAMVRPEGKVLWFLDEEAAGEAPGSGPHR
jgi:6-phosphogluconolactonase